MSDKRGAVDSADTQKAGCGIRYNPEQLGEETGFDFSDAAQQLTEASEEPAQTSAPENQHNKESD